MTTRTLSHVSRKLVAVTILSAALFGPGLAQADSASCLFGGAAPQAEASRFGGYPQEVNQQMARIEAALRAGQISPFEAGQLMRQQWEVAQFQRGFLANAAVGGAPQAKPCKTSGCALGPDLGAKLGPLVGDMAKNGMETASTVMRALRRETERLLQDPAPLEGPAL